MEIETILETIAVDFLTTRIKPVLIVPHENMLPVDSFGMFLKLKIPMLFGNRDFEKEVIKVSSIQVQTIWTIDMDYDDPLVQYVVKVRWRAKKHKSKQLHMIHL